MTANLVPVNDLQRRLGPLRGELLAVAGEVLSSGGLILGEQVASFESEFAAYLGAGHCVGVANGTDAIELALRAAGVRPGDGVGTAANAGGYAACAIRAIGAKPVFVEIDGDSGNLSPAALQREVGRARLDAVIVTHLYGRMADVEALSDLARDAGIALIEDCAQAHGARVAGRAAGTWGDAAAFSFYPTKNLGALGDGGAVVTSREDIAAEVRVLRQYGWTSRFRVGAAGGRNSRLDELQAGFLRRMLPHLDAWNDRRREIAARMTRELAGTGLVLPKVEGGSTVHHLYVVRCARRDALQERLARLGVQSDVHYPVADHRQEAHRTEARLSHTEEHCRTVLTLPCFPGMTDDEVGATIAAVRQAVSELEDESG